MRRPIISALVLPLAVCVACATTPAPDPKTPGPVSSAPPPDPDPQNPPDPQASASHVDAALESMIMGAMVGSMFGLVGAGVGAVGLGIYGAVTGDVPLDGRGGGGGASTRGSEAEKEDEMEREIDTEMAKQDQLEGEIEKELERQEELLKQIDTDEKVREAEQSESATGEVTASIDPLAAPTAPKPRDLPASIFEEKPRKVAKGEWGNTAPLDVVAKSLDADRDGAPEEIRYFDQKTGVIVRREVDQDYDGRIDTWVHYDAGITVAIERDTDGDGKIDEWQTYGRDGLMASREVDRNADGTRDAFYEYSAGSLVEERHDGNSDGKIDRIVHYQDRKLVQSEEDLDHDGRMDTWTYFETVGGRSQVARVERDSNGDGKPDTFETYEQLAGKPTLKQRDEDKNGDGKIDVHSVYENGKLKQREISDPTLTPLSAASARRAAPPGPRQAAGGPESSAERPLGTPLTAGSASRSTAETSVRRPTHGGARLRTAGRLPRAARRLAQGCFGASGGFGFCASISSCFFCSRRNFSTSIPSRCSSSCLFCSRMRSSSPARLRSPTSLCSKSNSSSTLPREPSLASAEMRTRFLPSRTGTKPVKLPSGARRTSVENSPVLRFVSTTSSTSAKLTPWSSVTMSPGFWTGV